MADDVLNSAERELLSTRTAATTAARHGQSVPAERVRAAAAAPASVATTDHVKPHDFKRPRSVDDDQLRMLHTLNERVARGFSAALAIAVRCPARAKLAAIDQPTYAEWLRGLETPACLSVLRAAPLSGELALEIGLSILFPILDRMLGGGREAGPLVRRPLTDIESRLASRIVQPFLAEMAKAWRDVAELSLAVLRVESDPQAARLVLPTEGVVRVKFDLTMGTAHGPMTLCLPATALRSVAHELAASPSTKEVAVATGETIAQVTQQVRQAKVEVVARLASTRARTAELVDLREGDVIVTSHASHRPLEVTIEGATKFLAQAGALKGRKAVQIEAVYDEPGENATPES
jgi:flagellar motor switch protein FliM